MTLLYVIGEGGRPSYAVYTEDVPASDLPEAPEALDVLRGSKAVDAIDRLEEAGQAIADACEHILDKVRAGLATSAPTELELTFSVGFAGEGGLPVIAKASAEAGIQVRALWKASESA
jgi:hypothetical protein